MTGGCVIEGIGGALSACGRAGGARSIDFRDGVAEFGTSSAELSSACASSASSGGIGGAVMGIAPGSGGGYCTHTSNLFLPWHRPYLALYEVRMSCRHFKYSRF